MDPHTTPQSHRATRHADSHPICDADSHPICDADGHSLSPAADQYAHADDYTQAQAYQAADSHAQTH